MGLKDKEEHINKSKVKAEKKAEKADITTNSKPDKGVKKDVEKEEKEDDEKEKVEDSIVDKEKKPHDNNAEGRTLKDKEEHSKKSKVKAEEKEETEDDEMEKAENTKKK